MFHLIEIGDSNRHTGATHCHKNSSRSHSIFRILIESRVMNRSELSDNNNISWSTYTDNGKRMQTKLLREVCKCLHSKGRGVFSNTRTITPSTSESDDDDDKVTVTVTEFILSSETKVKKMIKKELQVVTPKAKKKTDSKLRVDSIRKEVEKQRQRVNLVREAKQAFESPSVYSRSGPCSDTRRGNPNTKKLTTPTYRTKCSRESVSPSRRAPRQLTAPSGPTLSTLKRHDGVIAENEQLIFRMSTCRERSITE